MESLIQTGDSNREATGSQVGVSGEEGVREEGLGWLPHLAWERVRRNAARRQEGEMQIQ